MRIGLGIGLDFAKKRGVLIAPVATAATSVTGTSFVANWNAYDGATTYYLDVSTSPTFATFVLQNQPILAPTTSYTVTGLTSCTTYYYRVRAEGNKPTISIAPTLSPSGTQLTGTLITCGTGTWNNQGSTFNYQWKRNGVSISGATSSTYTLQVADEGTTITCEVQNQNAFGKSPYVVTSNSVSATAFDPDAQAYINAIIAASGTLTNANKENINTLFLSWKSDNIYSKIFPYLFLGGNTNSARIQAISLQVGSFSGSGNSFTNNNYSTGGGGAANSKFTTFETFNNLNSSNYGYLIGRKNSASGQVSDVFGVASNAIFHINLNSVFREKLSSLSTVDNAILNAGIFGSNFTSSSYTQFFSNNTNSVLANPPWTPIAPTNENFNLGFIPVVSNCGVNEYQCLVLTNGLTNVEWGLLKTSLSTFITNMSK